MFLRIILISLFFKSYLICQTISGYVKDAISKEPLIGVTVICKDNNKAIVSNNYGFYSLKLQKDSIYRFTISYVGYKKLDTVIHLKNNISVSFYLRTEINLDEVEIKAESPLKISQTLSPKDIKQIPTFLGEPDIIKAFQTQPGVKQGAEGFSSMLIRGGTADQVQYIVDDMNLYYVNHMGGFISTFNTDAISKAELYKNHTPANYSGRLSGVLDIRLKEGNLNKWSGTASTGLLSTKLNLNGPVIKNKSTLQISARRLNLDLFTTPILKLAKAKTQPRYWFYDLMLKYTHQLNSKNKISLSLYNSKDDITILTNTGSDPTHSTLNFKYTWGNTAAALRLMQSLNSRLFLTHIISGSLYNYNLNLDYKNFEDNAETYGSNNSLNMNLKNAIVKSSLEYYLSNNFKLSSGISFEMLASGLGTQNNTTKSGNYTTSENVNGSNTQSQQLNFFSSVDFTLLQKFKFSLGGNDLIFKSNNYSKNYFQPRLLVQYKINLNNSTSLSYCKNVQPLHLLTNNGVGMPTDIWVPADNYAVPQQARQLNLNYTHFIAKRKYSLQTDVYYKTQSDLIRYSPAFNLFNTQDNWHNSIETKGKGLSYGVEILLKKETGKLTGFLAYTLSKTTNQFANLNNGKPFYANYDRRHEINLFTNYQVSKKMSLNANFNFATGNAITLPSAVYNVPYPSPIASNPAGLESYSLFNSNSSSNNYVFYYDGLNTKRTSNFHRLDIAAVFTKEKKHGVRTWTIGIYNVYNHRNPFAYQYSYDIVLSTFNLKSISIFQITPFFSYEFKF